MTSSTFKALKQNRNQDFEKIANQFKDNQGKEDPTFWKPKRDKAGNGLAIIRFLPAPAGEPSPTVRIYSRSFQGPTGKWYIENDRTSLGEDDPVNDFNRSLVGTEKYENLPAKIKEQLSAQKRKTKFISNIYVIKDSNNPENEGKVFRYEYGKFIRGLIDEKMNPEFEGDERFNPFDLWEGAALKLKITTQDKYPNYKKSEWDKVGPLFSSDEEMEAVWKQAHPLQELIAPNKFKSREELQRKLETVLGLNEPKKAKVDFHSEAPKAEKETQAPWEGVSDDSNAFFDELDSIVDD